MQASFLGFIAQPKFPRSVRLTSGARSTSGRVADCFAGYSLLHDQVNYVFDLVPNFCAFSLLADIGRTVFS